jgi:hypothetical protein
MTDFRSPFLAGLLWLSPAPGATEEIALEGLWDVGSAVSTGVSSDNGWNAAARIEGKAVSMAESSLHLSDGEVCMIGPAKTEIWHDDMWSFGSFGGSWADVGLTADGIDYVVELRSLTCDVAGPTQLIIQDAKGTVLLDVGGRVFVPLALHP